MRNRDGRILDLANRLLDLRIGRIVDTRRGLVHEQNARVLEEGAREAEELALALGEVGAGFGDRGREVPEEVFVFGLGGVGGLGSGVAGGGGEGSADELDAAEGGEDFFVGEEVEGVEIGAESTGEEGRV